MPTTVNGVGTHYYGKKNRSARTAPCHSCHRVANLESYDTRLWFVVIFIPIIPLGRKRIIDACPLCRRHFAANADTYEQSKQLQISGSLEEYRRAASPESALKAHGQLLGFRDFEQARQFRRNALERFPNHAGLCVGLASQLEHFAIYDEAPKLFEKGLALEPDMPEARVGVARWKMAAGDLAGARQLLDFLETPGAGQHYALGPIDVLSGYYQRQGRHEEALELAQHLLRELPESGQRHAFRSFIRKSEKALGHKTTILPPIEGTLRGFFRGDDSPFSPWKRRLLWAGLGVGLLAAGLFINNEYIRRHRTIRVVNACETPVQIKIDDEPPTSITGLGSLTVSEGRHRVQVSGPVEETLELEVIAGFFDRWFKKPAWILNPNGEAVLEEATIYYAEHPRPSDHRLIAGQSLVVRPHIDYLFEDPPQSVNIESKNSVVTKTAIRWFQAEDDRAFLATLGTDRPGALTYAERRLRRKPDQSRLLTHYMEQAMDGSASRIEEFLKSGLDRQPVVVPWHRAYQTVAEMNGHDQGLAARYDGYLHSDPKSGALLYLRGRIEPDWASRVDLYRQAIAADPKLSWPWMALGAQAAAEARWDECLRCIRKAEDLGIEEESLRSLPHQARMATGEAKTLVNEYRTRLATDPTRFILLLQLCDALAASGQGERIMSEVAAWQNRLPAEVQSQIAGPLRALTLYQSGKFEECERLCRGIPALAHSSLHVQTLLAMKKGKEVAANPSFEKNWENPLISLALSLELSLEGQPEESARWRERAIKKLESATPLIRPAAKFLASSEPPALTDLSRLQIEADDKALLCAALADRFPAKRAEYQAAASRYNILRQPPYHLVSRAIQATSGSKP